MFIGNERSFIMKKMSAFLLSFVLLFIFAGCSGTSDVEEKVNGEQYFNGVVVEVSDNDILVKCEDQLESSIEEGKELTISLDVVSSEGAPKLQEGDKVRIVYSGDDGQVDVVYAIYLLAENGNPMK